MGSAVLQHFCPPSPPLPQCTFRGFRPGTSTARLSQPFPRFYGTHQWGWSGQLIPWPRSFLEDGVLGCPPCLAALMPSCSSLGAQGAGPLVTPGRCLTTMDGATRTGLVASPVSVDQDSRSWVGAWVGPAGERQVGAWSRDGCCREQQAGTQPSLTGWNTHMGPPGHFCPQ